MNPRAAVAMAGRLALGPEIAQSAAALHLFTMAGLALALPLYEVLDDGAHFFVARHSRPVDVIQMGRVSQGMAPLTAPKLASTASSGVDVLSRRSAATNSWYRFSLVVRCEIRISSIPLLLNSRQSMRVTI